MSYDWKKIFENKTNKELYQIYTGKTLLPDETFNYAKQELEKRNFDFNNMEANKSAWKLSELLIDKEDAEKVIQENNIKTIPTKTLYILIPGIIIIYILIVNVLNYNIPIVYLLIMIGTTIFYVFFTNFLFNKKKHEQKNRIERIYKLKEKLEENVPAEKMNPIKKDILRNIEEKNKSKKVLNYILLGIVMIFLLITIIKQIV